MGVPAVPIMVTTLLTALGIVVQEVLINSIRVIVMASERWAVGTGELGY